MASITPVYTDNVSVVALQTLARGLTARGTLDLRADFGAWLFLKIGRGGATALSAGVDVRVRRLLNNDTATSGATHPVGIPLKGGTTAAAQTTVNVDSTAGQAALNVASVSGFAAGDLICVQDAGLARVEFHTVSKTAVGVLTLDRPLQFAHTAAQGDSVRNQSDVFAPLWVAGGSLYGVVFDYGSQTTGDTITVAAFAQVFANESVA